MGPGKGSRMGNKQVGGHAIQAKPIPKRKFKPTPNADHQPRDASSPRTVRLGGPGTRSTRGSRDR